MRPQGVRVEGTESYVAKIGSSIGEHFTIPISVFDEVISQYGQPLRDEGEDKVEPLSSAVQRCVAPGASLYFGFGHARAHAAAWEIVRQFWGKQPRFQLISTGLLEFGIVMLHGGLVSRITAAFAGNAYPGPGPNRIVQRAIADHGITIEEGTNLTVTMRLMAGAFGLPFTPARSLKKTSLANANNGYAEVENPFGGEERVAVLKALQPDLAIVHAYAADRAGNAIMLGPYGDDAWGAFASRRGVLLTVERIVPTEFIREHAHLVRLPAYMVRSVSECRFGAHPQPMTSFGLQDHEYVSGYGEDYEFRRAFLEACLTDVALDKWIYKWILNCRHHTTYLRRLGGNRLSELRCGLTKSLGRVKAPVRKGGLWREEFPTSGEAMVVEGAREVIRRVRDCGYRTVLAGAGIANVAAGIAVMCLKREGIDVEMMTEAGSFGFFPRFGDPYLFSVENMFTNKMHAGFVSVLGVFACGSSSRCLAVVGAGQIDVHGNINSTRQADGRFLVGSGGANDLGNGAQDVVVLCKASPRRLVASVPYVTTSGERVSTLVTNLGVFQKNQSGRFELVKLVGGSGEQSRGDTMERLIKRCEWPISFGANVVVDPPATAKELAMVRLYDPERIFTA